MLRIQCTRDGTRTVLAISGRLDAGNVGELCRAIEGVPAGGTIVLDLADLLLADRDAVRFLGKSLGCGRVLLRNCPPYIQTWIAAEDVS
jgi:hypothetical protein